MRTIVGGLLILFGFISIGWANMLHFSAEADLLAKRPELGDQLHFFGGIFRKHHLVNKYYRAEFPDGKRIQQVSLLAALGMLMFFAGFLIAFNK